MNGWDCGHFNRNLGSVDTRGGIGIGVIGVIDLPQTAGRTFSYE